MAKIWEKIPEEDRKLVRLTLLACAGILLVSLGALYAYAASGGVIPTWMGGAPPVENADSATAETPPPPPPDSSLDTQRVVVPVKERGLDQFDASAHRELMRLHADRLSFSKVLQHAERILSTMGEDLDFRGELGQAYLHAGKPADAITHLVKALSQDSGNVDLLADLALAKFRGVSPQEGLSSIDAALGKHPEHPLLLTHKASMLGEIMERKGFPAESLFVELLQANPKFAEARYQFGRFLMTQGNMKQALIQLDSAVLLAPLVPRVHGRRGMALFYLGRDAEAETAYRTALAMQPEDANSWFNLGELQLSLANESEQATKTAKLTRNALESYLTCLALDPGHGPAHFRTGMILNGNRQHREAIRHLQKALEHDPKSVRVHLQLAAAWEALGDAPKSLQHAEEAYALDPFNRIVSALYKRLRQINPPNG